MTRFQDPNLRALTDESVRTAHRSSVYLGPRTRTSVTVLENPLMVTFDFGEHLEEDHLFVGMSVEQALALSEQLAVALAAARVRGVA